MIQTVSVDLGSRGYDILIGTELLPQAGSFIQAVLPKSKCAIVTDENVASHHLQTLQSALEKTGIFAGCVILPAGEATKSFEKLSELSEHLLKLNIERGDAVIAFGGGVIGDLAGFAASILRRGVNMIQIPTTLLAQVDSSVGGKTGINTPQGKNLIGTFYQPRLVLIDLTVLKTLPIREFRAGFAEVIKYGLLGDADFYSWLEQNWQKIFDHETETLSQTIEKSCQAKAAIVAEDETENGKRALLNLGHTFGHALEAWAGYSGRLLHGEAVAIGMTLAFQFSERLGLCETGTADRIESFIRSIGLPTRISDIPPSNLPGQNKPDADRLWHHMKQDKKVKDGVPALILASRIGQAFIKTDYSLNDLQSFLRDICTV